MKAIVSGLLVYFGLNLNAVGTKAGTMKEEGGFMKPCKLTLIVTLFVSLSLVGCASVKLKSYVDPSIQSGSVTSIAILPIRNVRLLPDESKELNRGISQQFQKQNPRISILGPGESTNLINEKQLSDKYSDFLRNYSLSGIPNTGTLKEIGDALKVDAILQGEVFDILQMDGAYGRNAGTTTVTVRYVLMSTRNGSILWQATSSARKRTTTTLQSAPVLFEVVLLANEKILTALPTLGE